MVKGNFFREHKVLLIFAGIFLLFALIFLGVKLYLYINYLIGNDLVVQLSSDSRDLSLVYGEMGNASFGMSKITSPLCQTECSYSFFDISRNASLDNASIDLGQISQNKKESILQDRFGSGQRIYRFSLTCRNIPTFFCHTSGLPVSKDELITVKYNPNQEQTNSRDVLAQTLYNTFNQTANLNSSIYYLKSKIREINSTLAIEDNLSDFANLSSSIDYNFGIARNSWSLGDYESVNRTLFQIEEERDKLLSDFVNINKTIYSKIGIYNGLVDSLSSYYNNLSILAGREMNQSQAASLDYIISNFNLKIEFFSTSSDIEEKINITSEAIASNLSLFYITNGSFSANNSIKFNLTKINASYPGQISANFSLEDPLPTCCVYNQCKPCGNSLGVYPIIFIPGHDFNKDISAEYSLDAFQEIQKMLDSEGFLNAGQITLYDTDPNVSGSLGLSGVPMTFRSTYYYDVLKEPNSGYLPVQVKSENIDTYAIKLKSLVDKLRYETGQQKVIIVAHSMGGLVARRYVQLFGNESVKELVLVATPNNGITGNVLSLCSLFGAKPECTDLAAGSLFLNKLNNDPSSYVKTYDIIGIGCQMNEGDGDGIVLKSSAELPDSTEYYIQGNCSGIDVLHTDILHPELYPSFYDTVKRILTDTEGS